MGDLKIIQLIPAPASMYVVFKEGSERFKNKIVALALVEDKEGKRDIKAIDCDSSGEFGFVDYDLSFDSISFKELEGVN